MRSGDLAPNNSHSAGFLPTLFVAPVDVHTPLAQVEVGVLRLAHAVYFEEGGVDLLVAKSSFVPSEYCPGIKPRLEDRLLGFTHGFFSCLGSGGAALGRLTFRRRHPKSENAQKWLNTKHCTLQGTRSHKNVAETQVELNVMRR